MRFCGHPQPSWRSLRLVDAPRDACPKFFAQLELLQLAGRRPWEGAHEANAMWNFEVRHVRSAEVYDLLFLGHLPIPKNHERHWRLPPLLGRDADDSSLQDCRILVEDVLDLNRGDVLTPGDDHVFGAVDDVDIAVGIDRSEVARVEPAIADRLGGLLRLLPVAGE